ncbi:hypothetical protein ACFJGW_11255 [Burkholderiaceae bacterium UC74_6]
MSTNHALPLQSADSAFAQAVDRWIWVFMAAFFVVITLTGFIPDSLMKVEMVRAGARAPFPIALHAHAILMGAFLLLLLTQATLMATGRRGAHLMLGSVAFVLVPAIVVVGIVLVPTIYHQVWNAAQAAPPPVQEQLQHLLGFLDNISLLQVRIGILFPVCIALALRARRIDADFHKRMMFLATALPLPAAIDRIGWLPTTMPEAPLATELYTLMAVSPMFLWDLVRHRSMQRAYLVWLALFLPSAVVVGLLWDTPGWHAFASQVLRP